MSNTTNDAPIFAPRGDNAAIEHGKEFQPKFGAGGLIPAIVSDRVTGEVLMFAHMNAEALRMSIDSGIAHFWSRSRGKLWMKGEDSGNVLRIGEIRTDCDQDVVWLLVDVEGAGVACHTGARSCFYRRIAAKTAKTDSDTLEPAAPPKAPRRS